VAFEAYYDADIDGQRARTQVWRAANPDKVAAMAASRTPEQRAATKAKYRANHPERVRLARSASHAKNRDRELIRNAEWKRANKHLVVAAIGRRTAAKLQATPKWADNEKINEFYFAAEFLSMVTGEWHHVDHIVPLQGRTVRGLHCEANLQVLTAKENVLKSNRYWPDMAARSHT
jgi:hypothetical protein